MESNNSKDYILILMFVTLAYIFYLYITTLIPLQEQYEQKIQENIELSVQKNELEESLHQSLQELNSTNKSLAETAFKLEEVEEMLSESKPLGMRYIGEYKCTAYCCEKYSHICGTGSGNTASGKPVQADVTVAVTDLQKMPYGTVIYIEDVGIRIVQDTGSFPKSQIDCAVDTHKNALNWKGQGKHKVYILEVE